MRIQRANWAWTAALVCAAFLFAGCSSSGDDTTGPSGPGQLTVNLSSSGSGGAAFLITLTGDGITNPVAVNGAHRVYTYSSASSVRVALVGSATSGDILRFDVPDVGQLASYSARLDEVAGSDNQLGSTSDFTLTVTR